MWKNDLIDRFQKAISQTRDLYALHEALIQQAQSLNIDDLLRFQIVHSISALILRSHSVPAAIASMNSSSPMSRAQW